MKRDPYAGYDSATRAKLKFIDQTDWELKWIIAPVIVLWLLASIGETISKAEEQRAARQHERIERVNTRPEVVL